MLPRCVASRATASPLVKETGHRWLVEGKLAVRLCFGDTCIKYNNCTLIGISHEHFSYLAG